MADAAVALRRLAADRSRAALLLAFAGDAVAMPVHWFYEPATQIPERLGGAWITKMEPAPPTHPYTFMRAPEADSAIGGRRLVGDVILKRSAHHWGPANVHVHHGMAAGENTLNAHCARLTLRTLAASGGRFDEKGWLEAYVAFMTSPERLHPDTYAESYHRNFFQQFAQGVSPSQCADRGEGSNSIGGLVWLVPIVFAQLLSDRDVARAQQTARAALQLTAPHPQLAAVLDALVTLIDHLLFRDASQHNDDDHARAAIAAAGSATGVDVGSLIATGATNDAAVVGGVVQSSCGIGDSWPAVLFLASKYWGRPDQGLLANANVGGDNCHRGFVLGSILGLGVLGVNGTPLVNQLADKAGIEQDLSSLLQALPR